MTLLEKLSFGCYCASAALGAAFVIGVILALAMMAEGQPLPAGALLTAQLIVLVLIVAVEIAAQRILQERGERKQ